MPATSRKSWIVSAAFVLMFLIGGATAPAPAQVSHCVDGLLNADETDTDCGGADCPSCADGSNCMVSTDCASRVCTAGVCQAPTCLDGVMNGLETDADCGGGVCPTCADGEQCAVNSDCQIGMCTSGICQLGATLTLLADPTSGGSVSGGGSYPIGQLVSAEATANPGWTFVEWRADGAAVSTTPVYTFSLIGSIELVAVFRQSEGVPATTAGGVLVMLSLLAVAGLFALRRT